MKSLFAALLVVISIPAFAKGHDYAYRGTHHGEKRMVTTVQTFIVTVMGINNWMQKKTRLI